MRKSLLSLMLLCFAFFGVARAEIVELGDGGTTNNQYLPGFNYYNYSLTQQIYTACEIGTAGTINSIAFKNTGGEKTRTYNVYMLLTDKETFTGGTDWVAMSDDDLVFSGEVTFTVDEWTTITLDTPFVLDGVYNLLVGVADVTGGYSSAPHMACLVYDATSQAIRSYRDSSAYDITAPGEYGTVMNIKNQIQLDITTNPDVTVCCPITSLSVYEPELTAYQARLMWEGDADNYDLEYKKASDTEWSSTITIGGTQYLIQDLQQNTAYNARVRSNCGTGYSYWKTVDFTTLEACPSPSNVNVSETTAHGFTASFTPGDETQEMWFYYWSTSNETPTTQNYGTAMATTFTIEYNANLNAETTYYLWIGVQCGEEFNWSDPATFTTAVACLAPTDLTVTLTPGDGTVASLAWTENGTATSWDVYLSTDAEFSDYTSIQVDNVPSVELTDLIPETTYYARVNAFCEGEGTSSYSNVVSFTPTNAYTLTVNDGTTTNSYVPVYGTWVDSYTKCQFIIPASELEDMQYGNISKMTFYSNTENKTWGAAEFDILLAEVDNTTFESATLVDWDGMELVYQGAVSVSNNKMEIVFDNDYQYTGGNLLVGFHQTVKGTYSSINWYGVSSTNSAIGGYESNAKSLNVQNFLPKTTFAYLPGEAPACAKPTDLTVNYTGGTTAEVTWEGEAETYNIDVNGEVTEGVTSPYTLEGLAPATDYAVKVQADCGSIGTSDWTSAVSFTGLGPVPTLPTDVEVTPTATTGEVAWVAGENNGSWNLRWRPYVDPALAPTVWDLPLDGYEEQLEGWMIYDADGDGNNWSLTYSNNAQDDVCFTSASYSGGALTPDNWLITPDVTLGGTLKFDTWNRSSSYPDKIMVYVCNNPEFESLDEFVAISDFIQPTTAHETIELSLTGFEGTGCIAFRHYDCEDKWQIYVDNIKVFPENGVEVPEWTVVENVTSPYTIEGLTPSTEYEVQVMAFNEEGDGMTDWTESVVFTTLDAQIFTKEIVGYGEGDGNYYLIASPIGTVNPENVGSMLDNEYDLYSFDQSQNLAEWQNYKTGAFNLVSGKGYLYANSEDVTLTFVGTPMDSDTYEVTLAYNDDANLKGWNLVGNPFVETAYIGRDFYTMNGDGSEIIASTSSSIEAMEGIFVIAEYDGETMTFNAIAPEDKGANLALNLSQGRGVIDRAIVRFGEGQQLPKLQLNPNHTKVYIPMDGEDYAVVRSEGMGELPVNFKAESNGTYGLSINSDAEFAYLHLIDNLTGADVDLLATPSYSFEANTTDYASRFKLVFATGDNEDNFAFYSNGSFVISNEGEAVLQVVDVTGRILSSENISGCASVNVKAAAGVYMLRLINGDNVKVQKVVVR